MDGIVSVEWRVGLERGAAALVAALLAYTLAACASYSGKTLPPGASEADTIALMGPPTGRYALPDGERLEYAKGPQGRKTFMLDFDAKGLVRDEQVLDERHFDMIRSGMSGEQVRGLIGRPSHVQGMAFQRTLWSWRYESFFCTWFQATIDTGGQVVDAGYGPDPICERTRFP